MQNSHVRFRFVAGSLAVAIALASGLAACGRSEQAAADASDVVETPYAAIAAGKVDVEGGLVDIAARQPGIVREVVVEEGAEVERDQVLARLDDAEARLARDRAAATLRQAQAQVEALRVALDAAERDQARTERLRDENFVSPQRVENARDAVSDARARFNVQMAAVAEARAALAQAEYIVEQHIVRAPDNGRIVRRYANPGMGASTLNVTPMFQLQPRAPRIVRAEVEERSLPLVHPGMAVEIVPEADQSQTYSGSVLRIAEVFGARRLQSDDPSQQTDERVVEVVVDAQNAPVLVGQRVLVKFLREGAAPTAPASAD
jgi:HlyD family secretion protein